MGRGLPGDPGGGPRRGRRTLGAGGWGRVGRTADTYQDPASKVPAPAESEKEPCLH